MELFVPLVLFVSNYVFTPVIANHYYNNDSTILQLNEFQTRTGESGILTLSTGVSVTSDATNTINTRLPYNTFFMELMIHFTRERIPERVAHGKGYGVFGYFKVTHDLSDICSAKVFDTVGKVTPTLVRFSEANERIGGRDTVRDLRGFAIKFYTEEGNLDLLGLNTEMFSIKDPIFFPAFNHVFHKNPKTQVDDSNMMWDFLTLRPETLHWVMRIFGDRGIPNGYRHMPGFPIHTFELLNKHNDRTYVKFHILPDAGIKNLTAQQAATIQATDTDFAIRDLYNAIHDGNYPSWTVYVQTIAFHNRNKVGFDIFDITKTWPTSRFPLRPVGKLVLNEIPDNQFASVEQAAFNPAQLVNSIRGVDSVFEARAIAYRTNQNYRLGSNFNKIYVNCPFARANTYSRDSNPPVGDNGGDGPNFFPNSFHGPEPIPFNMPPRLTVFTDPNATNFEQAGELYTEMNDGAKCRLVDNILSGLSETKKAIQHRALRLFKLIHKDLARRLEYGLKHPSHRQSCPQL